MHRSRPRFCPELFRSEKVHFHWVPVLFFLTPPAAGDGSFRENAMHNASIISALILMLSFIGSAAQAQIAPQQTPSQDVLAPAPKLNLTLEQRHTIKEFVKDMKADAADVQAAIGEPIPPGINPRPMPSDVGQKVPQVKTHRFFLTAQQIVIVDPKDNKVADVIKLGAD